ncbi:hypothetical protein B7C51_25035 (plasmid) [Paenibacillus larvae subsp. pulvifaciens]|uniref:Uncharacterized protein n=1 Tax=Paenibacillus larvae subsp. pulvifaciens TaxID=1477 RepID=A0A1V0V0R1_9BACL|nr:hypothetical protein [Paenibacillus larvae]ARF70740.1 hypothetical protein B7C51_25035 [Paenibacillus larvae subsp. pulvifaciens]
MSVKKETIKFDLPRHIFENSCFECPVTGEDKPGFPTRLEINGVEYSVSLKISRAGSNYFKKNNIELSIELHTAGLIWIEIYTYWFRYLEYLKTPDLLIEDLENKRYEFDHHYYDDVEFSFPPKDNKEVKA